MQTFLPYKSFKKSAQVLDNKRLGKQRVEAMQILNLLMSGDETAAWRNHPAVLQWKGHEGALFRYLRIVCKEWLHRGFNGDKMILNCEQIDLDHGDKLKNKKKPKWLNKALTDSHRSRLLQKDKKHYSQFKWKVPLDLEYVWPVRKTPKKRERRN